MEQKIFQTGSKTYYNSTLLFPQRVRKDVIKLYSFVRVADNYVDSIPQHRNEFRNLVATWQEYRTKPMGYLTADNSDNLNVRVTKNMCRLMICHQFDPGWVDAFLLSMEMDTKPKVYRTLDDTLHYVHGSAEVIGLMMAKIMHLGDDAMAAAAVQGRAMQYINFLRDISEDIELGRCYFAKSDLQQFGLGDLGELTAKAYPEEFRHFVQFELQRYHEWQRAANDGLKLIPRRYRLPIQAAIDSYDWTARQIAKDPFIVYRHKVKPSRARIIGNALTHVFD